MIDIANGQVYCPDDATHRDTAENRLTSLRRLGQPFGAHAVLLAGPRRWLSQIDAWGEPPQAQALMRQLKSKWDPANALNPGEFPARSRS